ncbi:DUF2778 domain-containing protein [Cronobacter muytjensii]|nr:DUF2778 domain-containing protein [Cronobacter muytjensii]
MAFSGDSTYRNRGGCVALPVKGPLSPGRYLIVDRPQGGAGSRIRTQVIDAWNSVAGFLLIILNGSHYIALMVCWMTIPG